MIAWRKDNRKPANTSTQSDKTNTGRTRFYQALSIAAAKLTSFLSDIKKSFCFFSFFPQKSNLCSFIRRAGEEIKEAQPANKKALSAGFRVLGKREGSVARWQSCTQAASSFFALPSFKYPRLCLSAAIPLTRWEGWEVPTLHSPQLESRCFISDRRIFHESIYAGAVFFLNTAAQQSVATPANSPSISAPGEEVQSDSMTQRVV